MAGEIMSMGNDGALLEDDYGSGRRSRKGKKSGKPRRQLSDKKKSKRTKQSSRIHRTMTAR